MTKNIFLVIIISVFTSAFVSAQATHVKWKFSTKKISDCEYDLIFNAKIEKGWHISSVVKIKGTEEVFPTQIIFKPSEDYALIGNLTETKPTSEYDNTIKKNVLLHFNKVTFTQRIKLNTSKQLKVSGTYEYQVCDTAACLRPPVDPFILICQGRRHVQNKWEM